MNNFDSRQTSKNLNGDLSGSDARHKPKNYRQKYKINPKITNKYAAFMSNPTVQPDKTTEMGVPVPDELNTEFSKEYQEENQL